VERIIREAQEAGEFDHVPGRGKPIPGIGQTYEPTWWVRSWVERERRNDAVTALTARLRHELPRLLASSDPTVIRSGVDGLNAEIAALNGDLAPDEWLAQLDVDRLLADRA
jgi:hypothetical protein